MCRINYCQTKRCWFTMHDVFCYLHSFPFRQSNKLHHPAQCHATHPFISTAVTKRSASHTLVQCQLVIESSLYDFLFLRCVFTHARCVFAWRGKESSLKTTTTSKDHYAGNHHIEMLISYSRDASFARISRVNKYPQPRCGSSVGKPSLEYVHILACTNHTHRRCVSQSVCLDADQVVKEVSHQRGKIQYWENCKIVPVFLVRPSFSLFICAFTFPFKSSTSESVLLHQRNCLCLFIELKIWDMHRQVMLSVVRLEEVSLACKGSHHHQQNNIERAKTKFLLTQQSERESRSVLRLQLHLLVA